MLRSGATGTKPDTARRNWQLSTNSELETESERDEGMWARYRGMHLPFCMRHCENRLGAQGGCKDIRENLEVMILGDGVHAAGGLWGVAYVRQECRSFVLWVGCFRGADAGRVGKHSEPYRAAVVWQDLQQEQGHIMQPWTAMLLWQFARWCSQGRV
jgi:hypothetical protein